MQRSAKTSENGFSLVEMLVVIGIIALMTTLVVPAISAAKSTQLQVDAQSIVAELDLARQLAASLNKNHEVRILKFIDPANGSTQSCFQGMQIYSVEPDNTRNAAGRLKRFGSGIAANETTQLSPALASPTSAPASSTLPGGISYSYSVIGFRPDGSTTLAAGANWLTLQDVTANVTRTTFPPNYVTIEIEPVIGSVRAYRP